MEVTVTLAWVAFEARRSGWSWFGIMLGHSPAVTCPLRLLSSSAKCRARSLRRCGPWSPSRAGAPSAGAGLGEHRGAVAVPGRAQRCWGRWTRRAGGRGWRGLCVMTGGSCSPTPGDRRPRALGLPARRGQRTPESREAFEQRRAGADPARCWSRNCGRCPGPGAPSRTGAGLGVEPTDGLAGAERAGVEEWGGPE